MSIQNYRGKQNEWDKEGLSERETEEDEFDPLVTYCLQCPCGLFRRDRVNRDGYISLTDCPRSGRHEFVYYQPTTQEHYAQDVTKPQIKQETTCEIKAVCYYEDIDVPLKELLVIPKGWTLEVEENSEYRDYLDLDMEMRLHRIPDQKAYNQWEQEAHEVNQRKQREEDIIRLRKQLQALTGKGD